MPSPWHSRHADIRMPSLATFILMLLCGLAPAQPTQCPSLLQTGARAEIASATSKQLDGKERWLSLAARGPIPHDALSRGTPPGFCYGSVQRACFVDDELVVLGPAAQQVGGLSAPADISQAAWFEKEKVIFNLPGYMDFIPGVQGVIAPIRVRAEARSLEVLSLGNRILNVTPLIIYPYFPFNMCETFLHFLVPWVHWLAANPDMRRRPLAIAMPHGLDLPSFWRLPENLGVAVETFAALSAPVDGTPPLCFEDIIGCSGFAWKPTLGFKATDGGKAWEDFREVVVANHCPSLAAELQVQVQAQAQALEGPAAAAEAGPLVVAFAQRSTPRAIRNLDGLLANCSNATTSTGRRIQCQEIHLKDVAEDVCKIQGIDVLVGVHGAHLTNALLMRRSTSLIEVRAYTWYELSGRIDNATHWFNIFARLFWMTNNTRYWWYGAAEDESFPHPGSPFPGRDSDVDVRWDVLHCMLERVEIARDNPSIHRTLTTVLSAGCQRPLSKK